jgi:hypothetical protein
LASAFSAASHQRASPGQTRAIKFIARQGLGLFVVDALQQVFQTAQNR